MSVRSRGELKRWICFHGSLRLDAKDERRMAKRDIRRGADPQPQYRTGKMWVD